MTKKFMGIDAQKFKFLRYNGRFSIKIIFQPLFCINVRKLDRKTSKKIEKKWKSRKIQQKHDFLCVFGSSRKRRTKTD